MTASIVSCAVKAVTKTRKVRPAAKNVAKEYQPISLAPFLIKNALKASIYVFIPCHIKYTNQSIKEGRCVFDGIAPNLPIVRCDLIPAEI